MAICSLLKFSTPEFIESWDFSGNTAMEVLDQSLQLQTLRNTIDDIPDEVLEFILGILPPYNDLQNCMFVCKRWYNCAQSEYAETLPLEMVLSDFLAQDFQLVIIHLFHCRCYAKNVNETC